MKDFDQKTGKIFIVLIALLLLTVNSFAKDIVKELQADFDNHPTLKKEGFKVIIKKFENGFMTLYEPKRTQRQGRITIFEAQNMNNKWDSLKRKAEQLARNYQVKDVIWSDGNIDLDLFNSIGKDEKPKVASLLSKGADVNAKREYAESALAFAAREGHLEIVEFLVSKGANVNVLDDARSTPLMAAVYFGYDEIVRFLINNGADVFQQDTNNGTALKLAKSKDHTKIIIYLQEKLETLRQDLIKNFQENMVLIKGGCSPKNTLRADELCVSDFSIGEHEVTQQEWKKVMVSNPSEFSSCGDDCPVENVSWNNVQIFLSKLNQQTGSKYRLPTWEEWMYAASSGGKNRAGASNESEMGNYAWLGGGMKTHPVKQKKPNDLGLYDMIGNVEEMIGKVEKMIGGYNGYAFIGGSSMSGGTGGGSTSDLENGDHSIGFRLVNDVALQDQ